MILRLLISFLFAGSLFAQDSVTIQGDDVACNASSLAQFNNNDNFGDDALALGDGFNQVRDLRIVIKWPTLADTMAAYAPATWDSARLSLCAANVGSLDPGSPVDDSIMTTLNKITTLWDEGSGMGAPTGGVTWDSASATGSGGAPNAPLDWTDGGQFSATEEPAGPNNDTVYLVGGEIATNDTIYWSISGATISDTLGDGLIILYQRSAEGDDGGNSAWLDFRKNNYATAALRPTLELFYTSGAEEELETRRRLQIIRSD